jgi:signal transduction histidine kinase
MRQERLQAFLWGQVLLFGLLGAALALFLRFPALRHPYHLPQLNLVLATLFMFAGGLVAVLSGTRFALEGRRFDLLLCAGFAVTSLSWLAFTMEPAIAETASERTQLWAAIVGPMVGWALIAAAPFARGRVEEHRAAFWYALAVCGVALGGVWAFSHSVGALPNLEPHVGSNVPRALSFTLAAQALINLAAVLGFGNRYRRLREDLDRWLALGATLMLFASLHFMFTPLVRSGEVSQGDFLRLLAYGVLLVGIWRAIHDSQFGRAVADERARVAREIHDGLAQYLFTISTHASMLESGADPETTLPRLKEAARLAQQEARYAILALSSAAGRAPFDSALRRYVDVLTADGALEVEMEIDPRIWLGPDEQIELFRIVQEGLANARKHAGARRAWVRIGDRGGVRIVSVRDDGAGFEPEGAWNGEGLRNMRERAAAIGGALSLQSAPGAGTAVEVVLRA